MALSLAAIAVLAPDYDEAIDWFRDALGFRLVEDAPLGAGKRWVVVAGDAGARLVIARAEGARQQERIGDPLGGRVAYFLETDDFERDFQGFSARGVRFLEAPRREAYGTVAVFADPWGGKWDLIEPRRGEASA